MKIITSGTILLLTFSLLSLGMPTFADAQSTEFPITITTDYPAYAENAQIEISGKIKESTLSEYTQPVTIMIINTDGNIVKIAQLDLNPNNEFSTTVVAGVLFGNLVVNIL